MLSFIEQLDWLRWAAAAALICLATIAVFAWIGAWRGKRYVVALIEDSENQPGATELFVLAHAYSGGASSMEGIRKTVREIKPQAHIMSLDYNRHAFSNGDAFRIAELLDDKLEAVQQERHYSSIVLVGHSMGALLVRKAYVYGCGKVEDAPRNREARAATREPRRWVKQVERFVLLAGMNRGWNADERPKEMPFSVWLGILCGMMLCKGTNTGLFLRQAIKGQPFVSNLRLQWLEVAHHADQLGIRRPTVIQLLGDSDLVVSSEDSRDVTVARDFIWVTVENTDHRGLIRVGEVGVPAQRKRQIQQAFGDDEALRRLKESNSKLDQTEDPAVTTVAFVLHGIRDMGAWTSQFENPLQEAFKKVCGPGEVLHVHRASYGYFAMGPFLLWADRQKHVRWFMDQVTELTAQFPNLRQIHFIGHSNGTYVLASALAKYKTLKVGNVALAGSVIRRDFAWSQFVGRVGKVRNYVGSRDLVVGLFPRLFEIAPFDLFNGDLGSAGFNGFTDGSVLSLQTEYVRGGHGGALVQENVPSIVDFIVNGNKTDIDSVFVGTRPAVVSLLSNLCWLVWLGLVVLVVSGYWKIGSGVYWIAHHMNPSLAHTSMLDWVSRGVYVVLLWLLLRTL